MVWLSLGVIPHNHPKSRISMNTHELREAERKEVKALWEQMETSEDDLAILDKMDAVSQKYRILRMENTIIRDWGFPAEEWATLSKEVKSIILDMAEEANRYEQLREDLQGWLEEAP